MISLDKIKVALIGSGSLYEMKARGCFDDYEIVGNIISLNPVPIYIDEESSLKIGGVKFYQTKNIELYLQSIKPDYIFINLEVFITPFHCMDEVCDDIFSVYEPIKCEYQIEDDEQEQKNILDMIQDFAQQLNRFFSSDRIILMSCITPSLFLSANNLLNNFNSVKYNTFCTIAESCFADITNCKVWDFPSKKCPLQKIPGFKLNNNLYFDAFYDEAKIKLPMLFSGDIKKANTPSLYFYMELFKRINQDIFNRKNLKVLISSENNTVLNLLLTTSIDFVWKHSNIFSKFYNTNLSIIEMLRRAAELQEDEILQFLKCYDAILRHEYFLPDVNYFLMFKYDFQILSKVVADVQRYCEICHLYVTVSKNNLLYYFNFIQLYYQLNNANKKYSDNSASSLLHQLISTSNNHGVNTAPIKVDVWGSCISRFIFYEDERNFKVNQYLLHVDPIAVMSDIQLNITEPEHLTWQQSMVFKQIRGIDSFIKSYDQNADWLITDCYFITAPNHFQTSMGYIQSPDTDYALYDLRLQEKRTAYLYESFENLIPYLNRYIEFLLERYGSKIILVRQYYQNYYIDASGKIRDFSFRNVAWGIDEQDRTFLEKLNRLCRKTEEYIINSLGCYVIDIAKYFLPDERSMLNLHHFHLERTFFSEAVKLVKIIIQNEPAIHIYDDYSPEEKINRYIALKTENENFPCMQKLFSGHWLDEYLNRIPLPVIKSFRNEFLALYKKPYHSLSQCTNAFSVQDDEFINLLNQYAKQEDTSLYI